MLGDGDFCMGATAIWTAVRHRIPLLVLINNNRSYFNDELHQETMARPRGREPKNRWIGQRLADPRPTSPSWPRRRAPSASGRSPAPADVEAAIEKGVRGAQGRRRLRDRLPRRAAGRPLRRHRPSRDVRLRQLYRRLGGADV